MRKRSLLLTVLLVVSLVGLVAPASAWEPAGGGTFNVPTQGGGTKANYRIVNHVERAIDRAQGPTKKRPNPAIHISTFLLDRQSSVSALVAPADGGSRCG